MVLTGKANGTSTATVEGSPELDAPVVSGEDVYLSSDLPVLHEVLNDANACFCPPEDLAAWRQALAGLLQDALRRQALAAQARVDSAHYSWQARAQKALEGFAIG